MGRREHDPQPSPAQRRRQIQLPQRSSNVFRYRTPASTFCCGCTVIYPKLPVGNQLYQADCTLRTRLAFQLIPFQPPRESARSILCCSAASFTSFPHCRDPGSSPGGFSDQEVSAGKKMELRRRAILRIVGGSAFTKSVRPSLFGILAI
jgi:hypothetical protein